MIDALKVGQPAKSQASPQVRETVSEILLAIEKQGAKAIRRYSTELDGWAPDSFLVGQAEIERARASVSSELMAAVRFAHAQVTGFAQKQRDTMLDLEVETLPGVTLGHRHIPVNAVGSYSPGGRYPLIASSIMTVATPKVAGVSRIVAAAPPRDNAGIYPAQLLAMVESGADQILCLGGVQALAAMAFGLDEEGIEPVDMIVGAGNAYVAEAKRQLFGTVGIDLLAGPTELVIIADESADPRIVAADLLAQAEHGIDSPSILISTSDSLARAVRHEISRWLSDGWPTKEITKSSWENCGQVLVCKTREEAVEASDAIAPEHLEVQTTDDEWYFGQLTNYGSIFLGPEATVAYSDKAIGTNHVLPTSSAARYTGGLWVGKFLKTVTFQRIAAPGNDDVANATAIVADGEMMFGHSLTARLRLTASG